MSRNLITQLIQQHALKTRAIIEAFYAIRREDFMLNEMKEEAGVDSAMPIGYGQTISQPYTVAFMLELLEPKTGQKILDVGSGSGWAASLLARVVGESGVVYALERVRELYEFGKKNASKYEFKNLHFMYRDGTKGLLEKAPFDRIHVAAAALKIPNTLKEQLAVGGRMVIPTQENDVRLIVRKSEKDFQEKIFPGFVFVPLIEE